MKWVGHILIAASLTGAACASNSRAPVVSSGKVSDIDPAASEVEVDGLRVERPEGWEFGLADASMGKSAKLVVLGPPGASTLRPSVVFFREPLNSAARRAHPDRILTAFALEQAQTLASSEMVAGPTPFPIDGRSGSTMTLSVTEITAEGESEPLIADVYALIDGDSYWAIYALTPESLADARPAARSMVESLVF